MFQNIEMYFYFEMREIFFFNYSQLSISQSRSSSQITYIFQSNFSGLVYFEISHFEIHGIEINILTVTNGHKWH